MKGRKREVREKTMNNNEDAWKAQSAKLYKKKEKQTETFVNSIRIFPLQYFIGVALIY